MKHIIIGTAGHVDHGKSALIKAMTGIETDRLTEEKMRGISIDLGFASMKLGSEFLAGIVDVPGHERFLKNMLAGTGGIDLAMLVIAADEGVMPQTKEHLAMLHLYGIRHGVVIINKADKVDEQWLELIEEEVLSATKDTFLADAPLCRVSAMTGEGIEQLKESLLAAARKVEARDDGAPFRLWVDRVFTVKGYGVVVTGSVLSGICHVDDHLMLYPSKEQVRVRGIECHGEKVKAIFAGQRAAINITGTERSDIHRGMFLSQDGYGDSSKTWDVQFNGKQAVSSGTRVRLHLGTGEFLGRIYAFKNNNQPYMRLIMEEVLPGSPGDKGILRLYSPQYLLGGIMLIAPSKGKRVISEERIRLAQALEGECTDRIIYEILAENQDIVSIHEIMRRGGYRNKDKITESLLNLAVQKQIIILDDCYMGIEVFERLREKCIQFIADFHIAQPEKAGLSREIIRQKLGISEKMNNKVLAYWQREGHIVSNNGECSLQEHIERWNTQYNDLLIYCEQVFADAELISIDIDIICNKLLISPEKAAILIKMLLNKKILIKVENMYVYWKAMNKVLRTVHEHFRKNETITVAQFRDLLNTSRKIALSLLEYLDVNKYTKRMDDIRYPGLRIVEFSEE